MDNPSISNIHENFVPKYDRWQGKIGPRIGAWFTHIVEITALWLKGNKQYHKHDQIKGTCRQHAKIEFGDLLYLTAEIFWMLTKIELHIVPKNTLKRVWNKFEENKMRN